MSGRVIVLTGPSGVGKDTVLRELFRLDPTLRYVVSYTTRAPRDGEVDGVAYWFIDEPAFRAMIERGEFVEWSDVYGELKGRTWKSLHDAMASGDDVVLKIDVQGVDKIRGHLGDGALYIFLLPPDESELHRRLVDRATDDPASIEVRLQAAREELARGDTYDHRVVNDDVTRAAGEILDIIRAQRRARAEVGRG